MPDASLRYFATLRRRHDAAFSIFHALTAFTPLYATIRYASYCAMRFRLP